MSFQEDMAIFQAKFKLLEREFEQWFAGALKKPPSDTQRLVEDIIKKYARNPPRNITEKSIFQMHQAKFNTYMEMWNRRVRLQEEGRLPSGREIRTRVTAPPPETDSGAGTGAGAGANDRYRQVFDSYVAAKQKAGEGTSKLSYDAFRQKLEKQAEQLRSARGFKDVNFGVSVKDGKVSLVARPKK